MSLDLQNSVVGAEFATRLDPPLAQRHNSSMRSHRAPPAKDSWRDAVAQEAALRDADAQANFAAFVQACALAEAMLAHHPQRQRLMEHADPLPLASVALLERLRDRARR